MQLYLGLLPILLSMMLYWQEADAQSDKTSQFLTTEPLKFSGFGGPLIEISSVEDEVVVSGGAGAALLFNQTFYAGFYGLGTFKSVEQPVPAFQDVDMVFGHGGVWLGYIHQSEKLLHAGVSLKIGGGGTALFSREGKEFDFEETNKIDEDGFFVFTPQAEMELNSDCRSSSSLDEGQCQCRLPVCIRRTNPVFG